MNSLEVLFSPADFEALKSRDMSQAVCVVFDILRATSSMVTALANGATSIIPVSEISDAVNIYKKEPSVLLAGEREGLRITRELTGSIDFDLGNSPREFTDSIVNGRTLVMTTTNGTRALRSCAHARQVLVGSFLNLESTSQKLRSANASELVLICSGTFDQAAYEDVLAAGAMCDLVWPTNPGILVSDSAMMARELYRLERGDLVAALARSRNGRRLLQRPELSADVAYCAQLNSHPIIVGLHSDGAVRRIVGSP